MNLLNLELCDSYPIGMFLLVCFLYNDDPSEQKFSQARYKY
jgi:hypothetical protein